MEDERSWQVIADGRIGEKPVLFFRYADSYEEALEIEQMIIFDFGGLLNIAINEL